MTAQAADRVRLGDRVWSIAAIDGFGLFDPADVGIRTEPSSSANWAGFLCRHAVNDGQFVLEDLWLSSLSTVDGRRIAAGDSLLGGVLERSPFDYHDDLVLRGLNRRVFFTGRLLVGDDFLDELYEHMGFHPAWKYQQVRELTVDAGVVRSDEDRSDELAAVRAQVLAAGRRRPASPAEEQSWIEQTFTRDYARSWPD